jgi:hypothetical protein
VIASDRTESSRTNGAIKGAGTVWRRGPEALRRTQAVSYAALQERFPTPPLDEQRLATLKARSAAEHGSF